MEPGYFSREAVKDLLAVREGEAIYLRNRVEALESENEVLRKKVDDLQSRLNVEQHYWKSI
jgi:chaperonin cofactor prefoldin